MRKLKATNTIALYSLSALFLLGSTLLSARDSNSAFSGSEVNDTTRNELLQKVVEAPIYPGQNRVMEKNEVTSAINKISGEALQKTNIGSAELYGFDMRLEYNLWRSFTVYGSAAYVYGQDTYINEPLPLVPPLNGRVGISGPVSRLFRFELAATLFATQPRTADWEIETPGYTLWDAYLSSKSISFGSLNGKLFLGVENILDRAYRNHLSTNRGAITAEPGRNVSVRLQLGI